MLGNAPAVAIADRYLDVRPGVPVGGGCLSLGGHERTEIVRSVDDIQRVRDYPIRLDARA